MGRMTETLNIIGGGMAGAEAAWQAAEMGVDVVIHEMRPSVGTFAHRTGNPAITDDLQSLIGELDRDDGTELENLFTDLWDKNAEELELIPVRA